RLPVAAPRGGPTGRLARAATSLPQLEVPGPGVVPRARLVVAAAERVAGDGRPEALGDVEEDLVGSHRHRVGAAVLARDAGEHVGGPALAEGAHHGRGSGHVELEVRR